jgi:hypothetical protein
VRIRPLNDREIALEAAIVTKADSADASELVMTKPNESYNKV